MTDPSDDLRAGAEKAAAMEWLDYWAIETNEARTIKAMLAEPRLPKEPYVSLICRPPTSYTEPEWDCVVEAVEDYHRALYAFLAKPESQLDEIRRWGT